MKQIGAAIGGVGCVALLVLGALAASIGWWAFGVQTADIFGRGEAHKQIQSAGSRIGAYNHFFDLCVSVQNAEASLDAQFDQFAATTNADDQARIATNIAALKANRMSGINQYNADARKDYTIGQFRASNLPYQLDATAYDKKGRKTSCSA